MCKIDQNHFQRVQWISTFSSTNIYSGAGIVVVVLIVLLIRIKLDSTFCILYLILKKVLTLIVLSVPIPLLITDSKACNDVIIITHQNLFPNFSFEMWQLDSV